jgi:hypothetical protein
MRMNLQRLARQALEADSFLVDLERALESICKSIYATYGVLLIFENTSARILADYRCQLASVDLEIGIFNSDDLVHINPGSFPEPFAEAALMIPFYKENEQLGALILGQPKNGLRYADEDVEKISNPVDLLGEAVLYNLLQTRQISLATELVKEPSKGLRGLIPIEIMEHTLRSLYDFAILADSPLADLILVQTRLTQKPVTHLDRGKMVYEVTLEAIKKLSPEAALPHDLPPREWYPYLILKGAYVDGIPNRDIMSKLYISEGTFNRTRRAAIRSVARALGEMEMQLRLA